MRLNDISENLLLEAGRILVDALVHVPSAWSSLSEAMDEINLFLTERDRIGLAALEGDQLRGWIGAIKQSKFAWELHPLVVDPAYQRQGWGSRLVASLEEIARSEGAVTIWLGTDDDFGGTNLYGKDLYPDVVGSLANLAPTSGHPFTFYQRLGFSVVGVFPDVNGLGKHDILMAKRV